MLFELRAALLGGGHYVCYDDAMPEDGTLDLGDRIVWYKNSDIHREDGPAIEFEDGRKLWALNGQKVDPSRKPPRTARRAPGARAFRMWRSHEAEQQRQYHTGIDHTITVDHALTLKKPQSIEDFNSAMKAEEPDEYDIDYETAASRNMLEVRFPARLNTIKLALVDIDKRQVYEPWRLALTADLIESIERNCGELLETFDKDRLPSSAWIARNLLELWVWVKYCGVSRENAWRFHEDALRDVKGLTEIHKKSCDVRGIVDETSVIAAQRLKDIAFEKLGLEDIDSRFLAVAEASKAEHVDLGGRFAPYHRFLSKFAHPTAGLVHGITHQPEICRHLQAIFTTQGVFFVAQSTLALEPQLGIPPSPD